MRWKPSRWGIAFAGLLCFGHGVARTQKTPRTMEVAETLRMEIGPGARSLRIWVPLPRRNEFQETELLEVRAPWPHRRQRDPDFGNDLLVLEAKQPTAGPAEIQVRYRVIRKEQTLPEKDGKAISPLFRKERGLIVINDRIRKIARGLLNGRRTFRDDVEKARALYDYVLSHMSYDKSGTGWGRGDSVYACEVGKGNCTDFHSLFIALALASDIPARFIMGYMVPATAEGRLGAGYHCWAEFHAKGRGWIPVDISEAWKDPSRRDYLFGNLDPDRVAVSIGREIRLSPRQKGPALNYLSGPYVEVDGRPMDGFDFERRYKNLTHIKEEK